jgi:hypothetical protein
MQMSTRNKLLRLRADVGTIAPEAFSGKDLISAWMLISLIKDQAAALRLAPRLSSCNVRPPVAIAAKKKRA